MLADLKTDALPPTLHASVCVVGAGPVGITLALSLARSGVSVVLLESGGAQIENAAQSLNEAEVVGRRHEGITTGRFRALGGTSTRWGGQVLPLEPFAFGRRAWVPGSGWPVTRADLEPFYARALGFEGLERCVADDESVWRAIRMQVPDLGPQLSVHASRWCPVPDFAQMHGAELAGSGNVRGVLHACVTSISMTDGHIESVVARSLEGRGIRVEARVFAFCGGAIETARLLLHPTEQGFAPPWAREGSALGRCFQDHPTFECADVVPRDGAALHRMMDMIYLKGFRYQPRLHLSDGAQSKLGSLSVGGLLQFRSARADGVGRVRTAARLALQSPSPRSLLHAAKASLSGDMRFLASQTWRYLVRRRAFNPHDLGVRLTAFVEQPPRNESRVSLGMDRDALGMRRARINWVLGTQELEAVLHFASSVKEAFERCGLARIDIDPEVLALQPAFLDRGWDNMHHMGTARMAREARDGVVDADLAIHGADNGFVCGCAVFPTSGFSNPTHTAIALAIRLADHLQQRLDA